MHLTRRSILAAAPAAAAVSAFGPALAQGTPAPAPAGGAQQAPGFYRYKVGDIEATAVNDGVWNRSTEGFVKNADAGAVQKAMEEAFLPPNTLPIPFTTTVLKTGGKLVLIDTGNGDSGAPTSGTWMANFKAAGFDPAQVNTIIISHFHGDHINGLRLKNGTAVFPNAEILVSAPEWGFWMDDAKMASAPEGLKGNFNNVRRVFGPIAKDVKQYEAGKEIAPGVTAVAAPGHTPGHTAYVVSSGNAKLILMSDTTNHPALFVRHPDWQAIFDMDGNQAADTRKKLLDMAAAERSRVAFYHAPFPATGYIAKSGTGGAAYEFVPVQWSPSI
ncbi:MAG TPA: MBL fold metallo-hydrolase [Beijerinckiaceae bacterium]|jgi:glyoxylase-like metal-dependent hydrolase (beta-lactamase superfamily II)